VLPVVVGATGLPGVGSSSTCCFCFLGGGIDVVDDAVAVDDAATAAPSAAEAGRFILARTDKKEIGSAQLPKQCTLADLIQNACQQTNHNVPAIGQNYGS